MRMNPFERGVIIVKRTGIMRLGSEPIVDGDDDAVAIRRDPLQQRHPHRIVHDEAAAMHVQQHRLIFLRRRRIDNP